MTVNSQQTQQLGPSHTTQIGNEVLLERLEALTREVASLRESTGGLRSRASTFSSSPSVLFVHGASHEKSEAAARSLNAVSSVSLPEGGIWKGSQDSRSIRRFLDSISQRVQASGLGPHGAYFYLINKCLSTGLAEELCVQCEATKVAPVDYEAACHEAAVFLMKTFHTTNLPSRFIERLESMGWSKDITSFDEYRQGFYRMMREADLLEVQMTEDNKRRLFIKGLPEKLKDIIEERLVADETVEKLIEMIDMWIARRGENPFAAVARKVVRAVTFDQPTDKVEGPRRATGSTSTEVWKPRCFRCGEQGHIKAMCPKRPEGKSSPGVSQTVSALSGGVMGAQEAEATSRDINWSTASLRLAGAVIDRPSPRIEVTLTDQRGDGIVHKQVALLDTGAQVTCCNRAFADRLYKAGVVQDSDIKKGYEGYMVMADDETQIKPLGTVRVVLEGKPVDMVVVPARLCADLIVGYDQLTANRRLRDLLVGDLSRRDASHIEVSGAAEADPAVGALLEGDFASGRPANAKSYFASGLTLEGLGAIEKRNDENLTSISAAHCEWPPVELHWKEGALESLRPNVSRARAEARQLELRMARKLPWMLTAYQAVIDEWISSGWLERVEENQVRFCLRHFGVEKDRNGLTAMARCRVVVDGKELTPLLQVPSCTHTDVLRNLLLWRSADVFAVLDISQAYMRIGLSDRDSFFLCICWGGRFYRFRSIPMGIAPSAQILQSIVDAYVAEFCSQERMKGLRVRVVPYMDDLVICGWSDNLLKGDEKADIVQKIESSLKEFLESKRMKVSESKILRPDSAGGALLGVKFSRETLSPSSKLGKLARGELMEIERQPMTRRQAVGYLSSFFDPLGIAAEVQLKGRLLAGQLSGLAWDKAVPQVHAVEICKWIELCQVALETKDPRQLDLRNLFVFVDASTSGIACMAVARSTDGHWKRLAARVRTYKKHQRAWTGVSSKIELLALQFGLELAQYIVDVSREIPVGRRVERIYFGTDSEVNLNRFASRRFEEITDGWEARTSVHVNNGIAKLGGSVFHVPGERNPADAPSRGIWRSGFDIDPAVQWYDPDRAVSPTKHAPIRGESLEESHDQEEEPIQEKACAMGRISDPVSLEVRYRREAGDASMDDWLRGHQELDSKHAELVAKGTLELFGGSIWVLRYLQTIQGHWIRPAFIPEALVGNALVSVHDEAGHFGYSKTLAQARGKFFWPRMAVSIKGHCQKCIICQRLKGEREWTTDPQPLRTEAQPWSVVGIDVTKGFDASSSHVVLTVTCLFTRYVFAFLLAREKAVLIVRALKDCFWLEGVPGLVVTDNGSVFAAAEFQDFLRSTGVAHRFIPRYSPWYGGFYEISHKCLARTIVALLLQNEAKDWKQVLKHATYLYNARPFDFSSDGSVLSPHEVFRGRRTECVWTRGELDLDDSLRIGDSELRGAEAALDNRREILQQYEEVWKQMRRAAAREIARRQKSRDSYRPGDLVLVYVPRLLRSKSDPKWDGPFRVEEKLTETTWRVNGKVEHGYNMKRAVVEGTQYGSGTESGVEVESDAERGKRLRAEDCARTTKRQRLNAVLALLPRGDMLWLE